MDSDEEYLSSNEEEEERDASTEDQHSDDSEEGEGDADAEVQASQPQRRPRRKRTVTKWPEDKIVVTELTEVGMPKEEAAQARMRRLAGLIARQRISLVMSSFNVLSDEDKMGLFNDCVQPWLEFTEELKYFACKKMMQMVAKSWRTHKSHLVRCFVSKGLNAREKHTYIGEQDWEDFVTLKQGERAKEERVRFKKLRERNKHDHHLGTAGYAGKLAQWEQEDRELADAAIANPWDQFPGRSRNFMRARGRLVISEGEAEIVWQTREAEILSQEIVQKQAKIESSGAILVRDKDVLTQALGQPEQTGRIRGLSSSFGWQFWPHCTDMHRKRKHSYVDVEAIKEQVALEITEKVTEKITEKVTNDIMARLRAEGVNLSLLSNTPSSAGGKNICASASDAVCGVQQDRIGRISEQLVNRSPCKLVLVNREGYQVEVATGRVFPNNILLYSGPVAEGYVVVHIDFVYSKHEGHVLHPRPRNEIRTLGDALYKKIQWWREWVVVSNQTFSSISAERATPGLAKSTVLVEPKVSPSLYDKADDSTLRNCASMAHVVGNKHNKLTNTKPANAPRLPPSSEQEVRDSPCTLVLINRKGYQVEVATGRVFPNSTELYSVPVEEGYVVVHIGFVCPEHEGHVLLPRPSKEIRTLGDALYKRVQWKREWVLVSPLVSSISARPPSPGLAKSNQNVLVEPKVVPPSLKEKANDSTIQNRASRSHVVGNKENKLKDTKPPSTPRKIAKGDTKLVQKVVDMQKKQGHRPPKAAKGETKLVQKLVDKQKQKKGVVKQQAQHTKSSERPLVWFQANPNFLFGQPMLPATELDEAGPGCATLHAYYMNACAQNRSTPVVAMVTSEHFLHESETLEFPVGFEDIFDLFTLDGLEMSILRCLTLCLIVEARDTSVPVGLLDPDALSVESIASSRDFSVQYLEKGLRKHAKKEYVMFPYNSGDHWIAVIIIPKWLKVLYIDSNRGRKTDLSVLKSVIDEAFANKSETKATKRPKIAKLTHVPKTPCLQQPLGNTCGFYASFNMMLAMRQTNLDDSKELDFSSTPINLNDIREKIAVFIVEQILDQNGEFSCGRKVKA